MDVEVIMIIAGLAFMAIFGFMIGRAAGKKSGSGSVSTVNAEFVKVVGVLTEEYGVDKPLYDSAIGNQWTFMGDWFKYVPSVPTKKIDNVNVLAAINRFYAVVNDQQDKLQD